MSKYYSFQSKNHFAAYHNFRNKLKEETTNSGDSYPGLEPNYSWRKMTHRKNIENAIALNQPCLLKEGQEDDYNLLVKYREAFSFKDEIGTCPNTEIDLKITENQRRNKPTIDKEMQRLVHLGILKQDVSIYF